MNKTIQGNFSEILKEVLLETGGGKIDFQGPSGGFVSVTFMNGKILAVDSTWGTGKNELQKIYEWESGSCVISELTPEEKTVLELRGEKPEVHDKKPDKTSKDAKVTFSLEHPVDVQPLFRDLKRESLDLNAFLTEVRKAGYSGEARGTTPEGIARILFYRGLPLLSSDRKNLTMREAFKIMSAPGTRLNFYLLDEELAHAFSSVLQGEKIWKGLAVSVLQVDEMLNKLMEKKTTGHICIQKGKGDRHYLFFRGGRPLGFYDVEKHWKPVSISSMWEDAEQLDYYRSWEIAPLFSTAEEMFLSEDCEELIASWNELVEVIARKVGRKPVEKSLKKHFGELEAYSLGGTRLRLVGRSVHDALEAFRERTPVFLREMEDIVGSHWLNDHLQGFQESKADLMERLVLTEVFSRKGD